MFLLLVARHSQVDEQGFFVDDSAETTAFKGQLFYMVVGFCGFMLIHFAIVKALEYLKKPVPPALAIPKLEVCHDLQCL